jgi:YidC/Oxa1 family membrane protein insertase
VLNPLYQAVSFCLVHIYYALTGLFGANTGTSWALAIVFLTLAMRVILIPLFVRQIRMQRQMQVLQPRIKELQQKYKGDKERLNRELMAVYKEEGFNPLMGCLPLLLQMPIFLGLFHVLDAIAKYPDQGNVPGFSNTLIRSAAHAKIFGVPISASFTSSTHSLHLLGASLTNVRILIVILIIAMGLSTFFTQRQLLARSASQTGGVGNQQKILMYVLPVVFLAWGFRFPLGVLLYWVTSNAWSLVQQAIVIRRMPGAAGAAGKVAPSGRAAAPGPTQPATSGPGAPAAALAPRPGQRPAPQPGGGGPTRGNTPAVASTGPRRPGAGQANRRNRRGRRR